MSGEPTVSIPSIPSPPATGVQSQSETHPVREWRRSRRLKRLGTWFALLFVAGWAVIAVLPVGIALFSSVKTNTQIIADPLGLPDPLQLENYGTAWAGPPLSQPLWLMTLNSVMATGVGLLVGLAVGTIAAYAVSRGKGRVFGFAGRYFVLLITVPAVVTWIPLFNLASDLRMLSDPAALGLIYGAIVSPTAAVLMRAYFASFPLDLIEAATIDGAGEIRAFWKIVLPMSRGSLVAVALVQGIQLWNELGLANIMLLQPQSRTLPIGLTLFQGQDITDRAGQFASLMIMVAPIVILYLIFDRRITEGMRLGSLK